MRSNKEGWASDREAWCWVSLGGKGRSIERQYASVRGDLHVNSLCHQNSPSQQLCLSCILSVRPCRPLSGLYLLAISCCTYPGPGSALSYSSRAGGGSVSHFWVNPLSGEYGVINADAHLLPRSSDFSLTTGCGGGDKDSGYLMHFQKASFSHVRQVS